ncbi:uncharacterized protein EV154DRAFT_566848 [Mucor mucedo]|uniref:uncharacterized protein n=1 Tax=Mucor mucedo TaxID=29922 RepID=UPI0022209E37|nr:uncharacterized protein EV154DRAFT_566848 [Mucor mucedo]KAI7888052.1 hypothetical protein EV154DRAFT_566848 [Mucor mucedo]
MPRAILKKPVNIKPSIPVKSTTSNTVQKQTEETSESKAGGNEDTICVDTLVEFLMDNGASMLFSFVEYDGKAKSSFSEIRDTVASEASLYFDSKWTKAQMMERLNKLIYSQYPDAYELFSKTLNRGTKYVANSAFDDTLNKICPGFYDLRSVIGSWIRRVPPRVVISPAKKPEKINSDNEKHDKGDVDVISDKDPIINHELCSTNPTLSSSSPLKENTVPNNVEKRKRTLEFDDDDEIDEVDLKEFIGIQKDTASKKLRLAEYTARYQNALKRIEILKLSKEEAETLLNKIDTAYGFS